jgi:signal transduction histidine kinase/CheY-like chemotaxis protein
MTVDSPEGNLFADRGPIAAKKELLATRSSNERRSRKQAGGFRQGGHHLCLIGDKRGEIDAGIAAFFAHGLENGGRCLLLGHETAFRRVLRLLRARDIDIYAHRSRRALMRSTSEIGSHGLRAGETVGEWLDRLEADSVADGFSGLWLSWEARNLSGDPLALEREIGRAAKDGRIEVLCPYNRSDVATSAFRDVLRTHPRVVLGDSTCPNPFYEPPEVIAGDRDQQLDWRLAELKRASEAEKHLAEVDGRLQEKLQELELATLAREDLLSKLAHELRNPLAAVRSALEVLRRADASRVREHALAAAERQVRHQVLLIDSLLDVDLIVHGKLPLRRRSFDLTQLARTVVATDSDSDVDFASAGGPIRVQGDQGRLEQAMLHLLDNARKVSGRQRIVLRVFRAEDGSAQVTVEDHGPDLEPEEMHGVWSSVNPSPPVPGTPRSGLGIGLAIVKGLIQAHGGVVEVRSLGPGQGNALSFRLPADIVEPANPPAGTEEPREEPLERRVLVIEDNLDAGETLRDLLELDGYIVQLAPSGQEGLAIGRQFHPEVVLCDLGLPGMNGFDVANALRHDPATAGTHLIAVTGYGSEEDRRHSQEAGFDLHLTKPVDPGELRRLLREIPWRGELSEEAPMDSTDAHRGSST